MCARGGGGGGGGAATTRECGDACAIDAGDKNEKIGAPPGGGEGGLLLFVCIVHQFLS